MFFKNLFVSQITKTDFLNKIDLESYLKKNVFRSCGQTELMTMGWVSAIKDTENLVHSINNKDYQLIKYQTETKVLPPVYLKRLLDEKVALIAKEQERRVGKREKEQIREDILFENLPRAFSNYSFTSLYIDSVNNLIVIDASNHGEAENALALLRKSIGTLPVTGYMDRHKTQECLNDWVTQDRELPDAISICDTLKVSGYGAEKGVSTFQNESLFNERLKQLISDSTLDVDYLQIEFDDCFGMRLNADGEIKSLEVFDVIAEQNEDIDEAICRADADFALFSGEVTRLLHEFKALGIVEKVEFTQFDLSSLSPPESAEELSPEIVDNNEPELVDAENINAAMTKRDQAKELLNESLSMLKIPKGEKNHTSEQINGVIDMHIGHFPDLELELKELQIND